MPEFRMPSLGADMTEGTLLEWLVKPGDQVRHGDIVAVVDTSKAAIEVECFDDGVVERLLVEPGAVVPVGTPLAVIGTAATAATTEPERARAAAQETEPPAERHRAEAAAAPPAPPPPVATPPAEPVEAAGAPEPAETEPPPAGAHVSSPLVRRLAEEKGVDPAAVHGTGRGGTVTRADIERQARARTGRRASPLARRLAAELGVDLREVPGSGAHGIVRAQDVREAAASLHAPAGPPPATASARPGREPERAGTKVAAKTAAERQTAMREAIGGLMARSKREIPHYYLSTTIDMATAMTWLRERNRELPVAERLLPAALLLKASALAARQVPQLNGHWTDDRFVPGESVHLGVAVSLRGGGLVTPALHDAAGLSLTGLMAALKDLVVRARGGRLRGSELTDATITVTNLGDQGVESVTGVIYPPQVALIGFGKILDRPWAVDGLLGVRPVVVATLAADHRATDGYTGARLLEAVDRLLHHPEEL